MNNDHLNTLFHLSQYLEKENMKGLSDEVLKATRYFSLQAKELEDKNTLLKEFVAIQYIKETNRGYYNHIIEKLINNIVIEYTKENVK